MASKLAYNRTRTIIMEPIPPSRIGICARERDTTQPPALHDYLLGPANRGLFHGASCL